MEALPAARAVGLERLQAAASPLLRLRSDEQLVTRFRLGNDEAFRTIHDRHRTPLIAYARRMLGDSADVEDLVQDVFLEAFRALRRPGSRSLCGHGSTASPTTAASTSSSVADDRTPMSSTYRGRRHATRRPRSSDARTSDRCSPTCSA